MTAKKMTLIKSENVLNGDAGVEVFFFSEQLDGKAGQAALKSMARARGASWMSGEESAGPSADVGWP